MHILDFPAEIIHRLLYHMALTRGVTRALRLRLVCKLFRDSLRPALFETRLLDEFRHGQVHYSSERNGEHMSDWYVREHNRAEEFWHSYITYRVRNETDLRVGRLLEIRQLAEVYCKETKSTDFDGTIDALCWMALERAARCPTHAEMYVLDPNRFDSEKGPNPDAGLNLLSIAAYLGNLPLAKQLIEEGHCPAENNELFDSPLRLAAWSGHTDVLQLFQEQLPEYEYNPATPYQWRAKTGPGALTGAAIRGDMDVLRLAIYPPSRAEPDSTDFAGFPYGRVVLKAPWDKRVCELYRAVGKTRSVEAFKYICSFFEHGTDGDNVWYGLMREYCERGNLDIVKHLVNTWGLSKTNVYGVNSSGANCLVGASRGWQESVVDFLLESGMDPERHPGDVHPLDAATSAGSLSIVRKLINHGASPHAWGEPLLQNAVRLEHTALLEFLLERKVCRYRAAEWGRVVRYAVDSGLESMVEILQRWGEGYEAGNMD